MQTKSHCQRLASGQKLGDSPLAISRGGPTWADTPRYPLVIHPEAITNWGGVRPLGECPRDTRLTRYPLVSGRTEAPFRPTPNPAAPTQSPALKNARAPA